MHFRNYSLIVCYIYCNVHFTCIRSICERVKEDCKNAFPKDSNGITMFPKGLPSCTNSLIVHYSFDFAQQVQTIEVKITLYFAY